MKKVKMHGVEFDFVTVEEINEIIKAGKLTEFLSDVDLVLRETDEKGRKINTKCSNGCNG